VPAPATLADLATLIETALAHGLALLTADEGQSGIPARAGQADRRRLSGVGVENDKRYCFINLPRSPTDQTAAPQRVPAEHAGTRHADVLACPVCGTGSRHAFDARDLNREVTQERFPYFRCTGCRTVFLADVPEDLARYYDADYYDPGLEEGRPGWAAGERTPPAFAAAHRIGLIQRHVSPGRLIEVGSGNGAFAVAARDAGFAVTAIEMNESSCRYLEREPGITAICSHRPADELARLGRVEVIAMWHVLEHLANPAEVIRQAARLLTPGGLLALAVPNIDSLQFRLLRSRWAHVDAPRHLCLIPPRTLTELGRESGLRHLAITTNDPDGYECNLFGWARALQRKRTKSMPPAIVKAALALCVTAAPLERTGHRGAAVTLLMQKR
jgi:2-polyprenyl-3-methyl-5-hydroxy-6-metoxy-1,4-benzoquinol methylase